jgi:hypothetical protein
MVRADWLYCGPWKKSRTGRITLRYVQYAWRALRHGDKTRAVQFFILLLLLLFCAAGGNPAYRTSAFEAVSTLTPVLVPRSSPEAFHARRRERSLLAKGEIMGEKWPVKFSHTIRLQRNSWVFSMPQSCDIGRRLYPSEGMHAEDFFARKIRRLRPGLNPRTWVSEASMLTTRPPLRRTVRHYINHIVNQLSQNTTCLMYL